MEINRLDRSNLRDVDEMIEVFVACHEFDHPGTWPLCRESAAVQVRRDGVEEKLAVLAAREDGELLGGALVRLPLCEDRDKAKVDLQVLPRHRRRQVGTALSEAASGLAREHGRSTVLADCFTPHPDGLAWTDVGAAFAQKIGFTRGLRMVAWRFDFAAADPAVADRLAAQAAAKAVDYDLLSWADPTPEPYAADLAYLVARGSVDVPSGDIELEAATVDVERLRRQEALRAETGERRFTVAARRRDTGVIVGRSVLSVHATQPEHAGVPMTQVDPEHRGHGLGTLLKAEIQRRAREEFPRLRFIYTANAEFNDHMIAVNAKLGFLPVGHLEGWQRRI